MKKLKEARLNLQAISRRDAGLMQTLIAEPGHTFISCDLVGAEPAVTANFSRDKNYRWATVDGVGKAPFYKDGVLMIDDIYLATMAVSPLGRDKMRAGFDRDWGGKTFAEQWLADPEVIKTEFKKDRQIHKALCLSECTLVPVLGKGLLPIAAIDKNDRVWDGSSWVTTDGVVYKGRATTMAIGQDRLTDDHRVLTKKGWQPAAQCGREFQKEDLCRLQRPSYGWSEVWTMVHSLLRNKDMQKAPLHLCRRWFRSSMEKLRQPTGRSL